MSCGRRRKMLRERNPHATGIPDGSPTISGCGSVRMCLAMDLTAERGFRAVDAISRATDAQELISAVLDGLTSHGLRGSWGTLRGDEVVMSGVAVPDDDTARIEEILRVPLGSMRFQTGGLCVVCDGRSTAYIDDRRRSRHG